MAEGDGPESPQVRLERLSQELVFATVYPVWFTAKRLSAEDAESFAVVITPQYDVEPHRIDYFFRAVCTVKSKEEDDVASIEEAIVATFDRNAPSGGDVPTDEDVEWFGRQVVLYAVYPYLREAIQTHANRLGMPNITMDLLRRNYDLPFGVTIESNGSAADQ